MVEQGEGGAMGQHQRETKFGTFSSCCWKKKKLRHHDGVGRDVSHQKEEAERAASEG